jgi:hypothetical protein
MTGTLTPGSTTRSCRMAAIAPATKQAGEPTVTQTAAIPEMTWGAIFGLLNFASYSPLTAHAPSRGPSDSVRTCPVYIGVYSSAWSDRRGRAGLPVMGHGSWVMGHGIYGRKAVRDLMSDLIKFGSVALDRADAGELAAFYAETTGGKITFRDDSWATVRCRGGGLTSGPAPGYRPPTWPDTASPCSGCHLSPDRLVVVARRLRSD